jgi:protein ImuB
VVRSDRVPGFLGGLSLASLGGAGLAPELIEGFETLGLRRLDDLRRLPRLAVRDRFGPAGEHAWRLASGDDPDRLQPRAAPISLRETLALPEAAITEQALWHALRLLLDRLLERPERVDRAPRSLLLGARLAGGGSWERHVPLREPTADRARLELALRPKLGELPAPVDQLAVELCALAPAHRQQALVPADGEARAERLREAVRHVRSVVDAGAALRIVEVDGQSRLPERRFALAPEWE